MRTLGLFCLGLLICNAVTTSKVLDSDRLVQFIAENTYNNNDDGLTAKMLYSLGKAKQSSSLSYDRPQKQKKQKSQGSSYNIITSYEQPEPQRASPPSYDQPQPVPQRASPPSYDQPQPVPQRASPPSYDLPQPVPQRASPPSYDQPQPVPQRASPPSYDQPQPVPQRASPPSYDQPQPVPQRASPPSYFQQQSAGGYGYGGQQGGSDNSFCRVQFIYIEDTPTQQYCICPDGSYGFTCTEGFGNPCTGRNQFAPAHPSLSPSYFIHCSNRIPYLKICPASLVWNQFYLTCAGFQDDGGLQQSGGFDSYYQQSYGQQQMAQQPY